MSHWDVVIRILRYLNSAPGRGLLYLDCDYYRAGGFKNVDWGGLPSNKKSTIAYCDFGGNMIILEDQKVVWYQDQEQSQSNHGQYSS